MMCLLCSFLKIHLNLQYNLNIVLMICGPLENKITSPYAKMYAIVFVFNVDDLLFRLDVLMR